MPNLPRKTLADFFAGICPACSLPVPADEPDGPVWVCPSDLNEKNPYYEELPEDWRKTEEQKLEAGYFANCPEGDPMDSAPCPFTYPGGPGHLPLHSKCYETGEY